MNTAPVTETLKTNKELNISIFAYYHNYTLVNGTDSMSESMKQYSYSTDCYVVINEGLDNEERLDFGKVRHAYDFFYAYVAQKCLPKILFLNVKDNARPDGIWGPNYSVEVEYGYSEDNDKQTLSYPFESAEQVVYFKNEIKYLHLGHINGNGEFYYHMIQELARQIISKPVKKNSATYTE